MVVELAVLRRPVGCIFGDAPLPSLSFVEFLESQVKGLVSLRGPGAGVCDVVVVGRGAFAGAVPTGLRAGEAGGGDQGIAGRAFVMLLRDIDLLGGVVSVGLGSPKSIETRLLVAIPRDFLATGSLQH